MKKIYCGLLTINDYLLGIVQECSSMRYIRESIGGANCRFLTSNDVHDISQSYVKNLCYLVLGNGRAYSIGYMAVTPTSTYYSDDIGKIVVNLAGARSVADAMRKMHLENNSIIYQCCLGCKAFSPNAGKSIMKASNSLLLICLSESEECFGPGLNFTPDPDWDLQFNPAVIEAMQKKASEPKEEEQEADWDEVIQPVPNEVDNSNTQFSDTLSLFNTLIKEEQKVVLRFAKRRADVSNLTAAQIALLYCLDKSKDTAVIDLIKTLGNK